MSFGTDGTQSYLLDPLAFAAEQAWHAGIVVVVAVGNDGNDVLQVNNPANDPYVIAVGSDNANGTATTADDTVSSFSNKRQRHPQPRPGRPRRPRREPPGPGLATWTPRTRRPASATRLFRGSGTSQAAAVVSGAAALLISQRPDLTPDQVKALLTGTAVDAPGRRHAAAGQRADRPGRGQGRPDAGQRDAELRSSRRVWARWSSPVVRCTSWSTARRSPVRSTSVVGRSTPPRSRPASRTGTNWSGLSWSGLSLVGCQLVRLSLVRSSAGPACRLVRCRLVRRRVVRCRLVRLSWSGVSWSGVAGPVSAGPVSAGPARPGA